MKLKYLALPALIVAMAAILGLQGYRLKSQVIRPLNLEKYENVSVFQLPFLARCDEELKFYIENAQSLLQPPESTDSQGDDRPEPTETEPTAEPTEPEPEPSVQPTPDGPTTVFPDGVTDGWFDNTLFVGDSRMEGLALYCKLSNADYFCKQGFTIGSVLSKEIDGKTLTDLLNQNHYDKIIVNFGLNEAGNSETWFRTSIDKFLAAVRETQPDAVVIFNAILPVTKNYVDSSKYGASFTPENLRARSRIFASYANGTDVFYIDCTPYFADAEGYLYSELTGDGCHPTATHYKTWFRWMRYALGLLDIE